MNAAQCDQLVQEVRRRIAGREPAAHDGVLLRAFVDDRDQHAFAALVERHGPMVLGVCGGILRNRADAEDAFQTTFLVLVQKACSIRRHASVASWLHGVALRVARKALAAAARRRATAAHANAPAVDAHSPCDELTWREVHAIVHDALAELPEAYRAPLVLCYLQGLTQDEAAGRLGWTPAKVKGRVQRGRDMLRVRLARRGVGLCAALGTTILAGQSLATPIPAPLVARAVQAAASGGGTAAHAAAVVMAREVAASAGLSRAATAIAWCALLVPLAAGIMLAPASRPAAPGAQAQVQVAPPKAQARTDRFGDPLPDGAVSRLGTVRFNHGSRVFDFHFTPDGKSIVSLGSGWLCLWDAASGKERARIVTDRFGFGVTSRLMPDGKTLLVLCQQTDTLQTWDLEQGKLTGKIPLPLKRALWSAYQHHALSADGRTCATHVNSHVQVWDTASGKELFKLPQKGEAIRAVTFAGSDRLVSADKERNIDVWDARSGKHIRRFDHGDLVEVLAASPDGRLLATLGHHTLAIDRLLDKDVIHVWDLATGTRKHTLAARPKSWFMRVHFSADSAFMLGQYVGDNVSGLTVWDATTGKHIRELKTSGAIATTTDGRYLVGGGAKFAVWNLKTGQRLSDDGGSDFTAKIHLSPLGDRVLQLGYSSFSTWDVASGKQVRTVEMPPYTLQPPYRCCSPDGRYVVSFRGERGKNLDLLIWAVAEGKLLHTLTPSDGSQWHVSTTAFAPDSSLFAIHDAAKDSLIHIWDLRTGKEVRRFKDTKAVWGFGLAFSGDGGTLFVTGKRVAAYDVATGKEQFSWRVQPPPSSVKTMVAGGPPPDENDSIPWRALAFAPDGSVAAGILWAEVTPRERVQDRLALCDARTGKVLRRWNDSGKNTGAWLESVTFSNDGRLLATSDGAVIHVWEVATGGKVHTFQGHRDDIQSLSFSAGGRRLASAAADGTVLIWDLALALGAAAPSGEAGPAALWAHLQGADARSAYMAIGRLAEVPAPAIPFLRKQLKPVSSAAVDNMRRSIAELASDDFTVRDSAYTRLKSLGPSPAPLLRQALDAKNLPLETRRRLEQLLDSPDSRPTAGEPLRTLRALTVLEHAATPEARRLLHELASGGSGAWLTVEAQAACKRLGVRHTGK